MIGSRGDDWLSASNNGSDDFLYGRDGDDTLWGGGTRSSDYLDGGPGDDHLLALVEGGVMVGGPGDDVFEFFGSDFKGGEIRDFTKGEDKISLEGLRDSFGLGVLPSELDALLRNSTGNELDLSQLDPILYAGYGSITLNVPVSTLDTSDFILD